MGDHAGILGAVVFAVLDWSRTLRILPSPLAEVRVRKCAGVRVRKLTWVRVKQLAEVRVRK